MSILGKIPRPYHRRSNENSRCYSVTPNIKMGKARKSASAATQIGKQESRASHAGRGRVHDHCRAQAGGRLSERDDLLIIITCGTALGFQAHHAALGCAGNGPPRGYRGRRSRLANRNEPMYISCRYRPRSCMSPVAFSFRCRLPFVAFSPVSDQPPTCFREQASFSVYMRRSHV
jgi:hypothetical protein